MTISMHELRSQIIADPDNDALRLEYAEILKENGDPQGELIEVQIGLTQRLNPARRRALIAREKEIINQHAKILSQDLATLFTGYNGRWFFDRGFIDGLSCECSDNFINLLPDIMANHPIRHLTLGNMKTKHLSALLDGQLIGCLKTLVLSRSIDNKSVGLLAQSEQLSSLQSLRLSGCLTDEGAQTLFRSPYLRCHRLAMSNNRIGTPSIEALVENPQLAHIQSLNLADNALEDDAARLLFQSNFAPNRLTLRGNRITADGIEGMVHSSRFSQCTELHLSQNPIGDNGLRAIVHSPHLRQLKELSVNFCDITEAGAAALLEKNIFPKMQRIELHTDPSYETDFAKQLLARWGRRIRMPYISAWE